MAAAWASSTVAPDPAAAHSPWGHVPSSWRSSDRSPGSAYSTTMRSLSQWPQKVQVVGGRVWMVCTLRLMVRKARRASSTASWMRLPGTTASRVASRLSASCWMRCCSAVSAAWRACCSGMGLLPLSAGWWGVWWSVAPRQQGQGRKVAVALQVAVKLDQVVAVAEEVDHRPDLGGGHEWLVGGGLGQLAGRADDPAAEAVDVQHLAGLDRRGAGLGWDRPGVAAQGRDDGGELGQLVQGGEDLGGRVAPAAATGDEQSPAEHVEIGQLPAHVRAAVTVGLLEFLQPGVQVVLGGGQDPGVVGCLVLLGVGQEQVQRVQQFLVELSGGELVGRGVGGRPVGWAAVGGHGQPDQEQG